MLSQVHDGARPSDVRVLCLTALLLLSAGCASLVTSKQGGSATESSDRCVPLTAKRAQHGASASSEVTAPPGPLAEVRFSVEAMRVADIIGVVPL